MNDTSTEQNSNVDSQPVTTTNVARTPAGIRAETDDGVYTFRRDVDAYERGENVWVPDLPTPPEVVGAVEYAGYDVRTDGENE